MKALQYNTHNTHYTTQHTLHYTTLHNTTQHYRKQFHCSIHSQWFKQQNEEFLLHEFKLLTGSQFVAAVSEDDQQVEAEC